MSDPVHILSLGGGVQSVTLARMAAMEIILPKPTGSIFSDTKWERAVEDIHPYMPSKMRSPWRTVCEVAGISFWDREKLYNQLRKGIQ